MKLLLLGFKEGFGHKDNYPFYRLAGRGRGYQGDSKHYGDLKEQRRNLSSSNISIRRAILLFKYDCASLMRLRP